MQIYNPMIFSCLFDCFLDCFLVLNFLSANFIYKYFCYDDLADGSDWIFWTTELRLLQSIAFYEDNSYWQFLTTDYGTIFLND